MLLSQRGPEMGLLVFLPRTQTQRCPITRVVGICPRLMWKQGTASKCFSAVPCTSLCLLWLPRALSPQAGLLASHSFHSGLCWSQVGMAVPCHSLANQFWNHLVIEGGSLRTPEMKREQGAGVQIPGSHSLSFSEDRQEKEGDECLDRFCGQPDH